MGTSEKHKQAMLEWAKQQSLKTQLKYEEQSKKCKNCSELIPYEKRHINVFCSKSCSAKFNNLKKSKIKRKPCLFCGTSIKTGATKYCSNKCQKNLEKQTLHKRLEECQIFDNHRQARDYLLNKSKKCLICGLTSWQDKEPTPLILDHINGNSDDNSFNNLRLVCANCDMQLPTYKSKNRGNGRFYRRQRYKEGKSC